MVRRAPYVVKPGLDLNLRGGFGEVSKGYQVGVDRLLCPREVLEFTRYGRNLRRIKAGTNQIENAAESQIIPDYLSKKLSMIFRGIISRGEIRDRETRLLDTKACLLYTSRCV